MTFRQLSAARSSRPWSFDRGAVRASDTFILGAIEPFRQIIDERASHPRRKSLQNRVIVENPSCPVKRIPLRENTGKRSDRRHKMPARRRVGDV
jgi:hypothetical protein